MKYIIVYLGSSLFAYPLLKFLGPPIQSFGDQICVAGCSLMWPIAIPLVSIIHFGKSVFEMKPL